MQKHFRSLNEIRVTAPCDADWDSMRGNDQVRFCEHCALHVSDLSALTRRNAMRLIEKSQGRLCVRYIQTATGEVLTKDSPKLHRIGRRVSRIAAGAFSAAVSLTSAAAQTGAPRAGGQSVQTLPRPNTSGEGSTISGVVKDPNGALVPGATVTLITLGIDSEKVTTSSDDGAYQFTDLAAGIYKLKIAPPPGFKHLELTNIDLQSCVAKRFETELELESESVTMGVVAIVEPADALIKAAYKDDLATVTALIPITTDLDKVDEGTGLNAVTYAIENHNQDLVKALLSAGASINSANWYGRTPLMSLNQGATVEFVRALISAGADVNGRDESGNTVLMSAANWCKLEVLKELISAGARIDAKDDNGDTILMRAAENPDSEIVKFLIQAGVSIDATNEDGDSALTLAARSGKGDSLRLLINAGAAMNLTSRDLDDALRIAVESEDSSAVKVLLDAGAKANSVDSNHKTPLMLAGENGRQAAIKALIDVGADLNAVDHDGWTALMYADDVESARLLLNAGADMTIKNKDGQTALAIAIKAGQEEIVKLLKSRGAPE